MGITDLFMTTVTVTPTSNDVKISEFLTVESLANFAAMTGALSAAWHALQQFFPWSKDKWVPYTGAFMWGAISFLMSYGGIIQKISGKDFLTKVGIILAYVFVGFLNALVLGSAVVGADVATRRIIS